MVAAGMVAAGGWHGVAVGAARGWHGGWNRGWNAGWNNGWGWGGLGLGLGLAGLGYGYGYPSDYAYGYGYPYGYGNGYGYGIWISGRRNCASGISRRRDRASDDRPKRGGRRKLLRDSREDLLTLPCIVGRKWLFLHGLRRPRARNGGIESSSAERCGSFDETAAETTFGRNFLESAFRGRNPLHQVCPADARCLAAAARADCCFRQNDPSIGEVELRLPTTLSPSTRSPSTRLGRRPALVSPRRSSAMA